MALLRLQDKKVKKTPATPDDLDGHRAVGFVSSATGAPIPFEFTDGGSVRNVTLPSTVSVSAAETLVAAARLGLGLIQAPRYHLEKDSGRDPRAGPRRLRADADGGFATLSA